MYLRASRQICSELLRCGSARVQTLTGNGLARRERDSELRTRDKVSGTGSEMNVPSAQSAPNCSPERIITMPNASVNVIFPSPWTASDWILRAIDSI